MICLSQISDSIYFDRKWNLTNSEKYEYLRIIRKTDTLLKISDYQKNGMIRKVVHCKLNEQKISNRSIENKTGICVWYDKKGILEKMEIHDPLDYIDTISGNFYDTVGLQKDIDSDLIYREYYFNNGTMRSNGFLIPECDLHLEWRYYRKNGNHWLTKTFQYGQIQETKIYDNEGRLFYECLYENGKKKTKRKFNVHGELKKTVIYENGQKKKIR